MIKPPEDVKASDLFLKLLETPFPSEVVPFPRKGANGEWVDEIRLCVLPQEDFDKARELADARLDKKRLTPERLQGVTLREVAADAVAKELLAMACKTAKSQGEDQNGNPIYARVFVDGSQLGKLTADEVAVLFSQWQLVQRKFGPLESQIDVDSWIARLVEGGSAHPLSLMASPDVAELAFMLSEKIYSILSDLKPLYESLPSTLQSDLGKFFAGMPSATSRPADFASDGSESYDVDDAVNLTEKFRAKQAIIDAIEQGRD